MRPLYPMTLDGRLVRLLVRAVHKLSKLRGRHEPQPGRLGISLEQAAAGCSLRYPEFAPA